MHCNFISRAATAVLCLALTALPALPINQVRAEQLQPPTSAQQQYQGELDQPGARCGTAPLPEEEARLERESLRRFTEQRSARARAISAELADRAAGSVTIRVFFHIINRGEDIAHGDVPEEMLDAQIRVLNEAFSGARGGANTAFRFIKAGVTHTTDEAWFTLRPGSPEERAAKTSLRVGGAGDLNIYTTEGAGLRGWATFPSSYSRDPLYDGVVCHWATLPGGIYTHFDLGHRVVHNVGHWLGLYHTFQGGCSAPGDEVSDTPAEASPNYECSVGRDTCPAAPGFDPVDNFMDDSKDLCTNRFTAGQAARMDALHALYRTRTFVHTATAANTFGHVTLLDHPLANGNPRALVTITPNWNPPGGRGVYNNHALGVYYTGSQWAIFNQDGGSLGIGMTFNVAVAEGANEREFVHRATATTTSHGYTWIDHPATNGNPYTLLTVTQNWNPDGGPGVYNNQHIGVYYSRARAQWGIINLGSRPMPAGAAFNVIATPVTATADRFPYATTDFCHSADLSNRVGHWTELDHPLLNDNPHAQVMATVLCGEDYFIELSNNHPIGVWYTGRRWAIFNQDGALMPYATFSVSVRR